jgi:hypothetical protein
MTTSLTSIRELPKKNQFQRGDTLVVFGEVFERGYVNGIIDEAKAAGMNIIYSTVGRRDENQNLRPLTDLEIAEKNQKPLINIPLEAGFDLEPSKNGIRPVDQLKEYGLTGWEDAKLDWTAINESRMKGIERFRAYTQKYMQELEKLIDVKKNIIFVHTMAGGFPRAKVVMPIANRVFKGSGARYCSSKLFWQSEIGRLCEMSFDEVTGETLRHLIDLSQDLRNKIEASGAQVRYVAYGYHGNEVLIGDKYEWYSYSPYLQGFAKIKLENIAQESFAKGIKATVFNVPEILTNSSSIFLGLEVVLYPLLRALKKEAPDSKSVQEIINTCKDKLKSEYTLDDIDRVTQAYLTNKMVRSWPSLAGWPQHNGPEQMELMRNSSTELINMHKDQKNLMTADLSEVIFRGCGKIMFHEIGSPRAAVVWIGHDAVAKTVALN